MTTATANRRLEVARAALADDGFVDAPTVSVHLNSQLVAHRLLEQLGWTRRTRTITKGRWAGHTEYRWISPDGQTYWETDEALTIALTALALND